MPSKSLMSSGCRKSKISRRHSCDGSRPKRPCDSCDACTVTKSSPQRSDVTRGDLLIVDGLADICIADNLADASNEEPSEPLRFRGASKSDTDLGTGLGGP